MLCLASEMNSFTSDQLHVAQQSRREKLRIQHCSPSRPCHRVDDYSSGLEVVQPDFNPDMVQAGDDMRNNVSVMYRPAEGPSEILTFSSTLCNDSIHGTMGDQASVVNSVNLVSSMADNSLKPSIEDNLVKCGVWKSVSSNANPDNWSADCLGRYKKNNSVGIVGDISGFEMRAKNITSVHRQSQFQYGDMNYASQIQYQNALSDGVTTAVLGSHPNFNVTGGSCTSWGSYGGDNEHVHNTPYGYQFDGCVPSGAIWTAEMSSLRKRTDQSAVDSYSQGLSLSLCSYPAGSLITGSQIGNPHIPQSIPLHNVASIAFRDSKPCSPNFRMTAGGGHDYSLQESVGPSTNYHRQAGPGPLGPFTGYATILKSSRFLQPAQQLLDEYCGVIAKYASSSTGDGDIGDLATAVNSIVSDASTTGDIAGVSVATRQESNDITNEATATNSSIKSLRPDYQAKKAKLLYMLEEVSRRYRQYYQQMQMVVSAFESVAGLASATPCISSALKTVSRHFSHLKNAISDQLSHIKNFLGEDFSVPSSGIRVEGGVNNKRLKYADHSFQKHKSLDNNMGLLEPQQHIWRPQRGLPERAVSVLRAWLFEHFLHPYPTDTDKHMLAAQTGLTRSQVSNWFINARVRLWKPMVEEVHMLETKGAAERTSNVVEDDVSNNEVDGHPFVKMAGSTMASVNLECPCMRRAMNVSPNNVIMKTSLELKATTCQVLKKECWAFHNTIQPGMRILEPDQSHSHLASDKVLIRCTDLMEVNNQPTFNSKIELDSISEGTRHTSIQGSFAARCEQGSKLQVVLQIMSCWD